MANLISGLIGALLATVIAVVYSHLSELIRRRYDVTLEVVGYFDDIYNHLQTMQACNNRWAEVEGKEVFEMDQYQTASRELRILVLSSRIHARAALIYGENSSELEALQTLRNHFTETARLLWSSNKNNWQEINEQLLSRFQEKIDPLRLATEIQFIRSVKISTILKEGILSLWPFKTGKFGNR